jgi:hypothetical protein
MLSTLDQQFSSNWSKTSFFVYLTCALTAFSTSIGVELLSVPAGFLDIDRFLFLLFASNKVEPFLTNGVAGLSVSGTSLANAGEAISSVLLIPSLLLELFSKLAHF